MHIIDQHAAATVTPRRLHTRLGNHSATVDPRVCSIKALLRSKVVGPDPVRPGVADGQSVGDVSDRLVRVGAVVEQRP